MSDHLVSLEHGWSAWKWVVVRGTGFPARQILELAAPEVTAAADELLAADDEVLPARQRALAELEHLVEQLRNHPDRQTRKDVDKARRAVARGKPLEGPPQLHVEAAAYASLLDLERKRETVLSAYEATYARGQAANSGVLREFAAAPRFREAVLWQNRNFFRAGIDGLLRQPAGANDSRTRDKERTLARYVQRYCVKNDTIGFFGPVGFGRLTDSAVPVTARPGSQLLDKRTVYFEHWTIDTLAMMLGQEPALRPHLVPRRLPSIWLDGTTVHYPVNRQSELPLPYARLLAACDARTTARQIARTLAVARDLEIGDEADVFGMLDELVSNGFVTWTLEVPTVTEWPERHLRRLLESCEGEARERAIGLVDTLEARRAAVSDAAGDPEALDAALGDLEHTFQELTSSSATRRGGQAYAARTIVFEDCRRDLDVELGLPFRQRITPPLLLLLQSARWYTYRIGELYRRGMNEAFELASQGASRIDYLTFWQHAKALFPEGAKSEPIAIAERELQQKWAAIVPPLANERRVDLASSDLATRVQDAFAAPHPGWPSARYHSPDILIAARSLDEINRGDGTIVLGEFHPSVCTMHFVMQKEHDDRASMIRARELDLPEVVPSGVYAKEYATRADHMWVSTHDVDIELGTTRSWRDRENVISVGALTVERDGDALLVRDRESGRTFDIVEFHGASLSAAIATQFEVFALDRHLPRLSIDGVVIGRERWRPPVEALRSAASLESASGRMLALRRWTRELGIPRWVFVKVPEEPKPVYVDFDSPIYCELFARLVGKASQVTLSEMVPTPEQAWLPDGDGEHYTSEFRVVIVDPARWQSP